VKVGIPTELKNHEYRAATTPAGVHKLVACAHEVFVQRDAGLGSSIPNKAYQSAGACILDTADDVWAAGELIPKVKEPVPAEYHRTCKDQAQFTYLHLAASQECTHALLAAGTTAIAYETVRLPDKSLPLLAPMSEVAGRPAPQVGAYHLMRQGAWQQALRADPALALRLNTHDGALTYTAVAAAHGYDSASLQSVLGWGPG
jgi:alanine dehydrogenase